MTRPVRSGLAVRAGRDERRTENARPRLIPQRSFVAPPLSSSARPSRAISTTVDLDPKSIECLWLALEEAGQYDPTVILDRSQFSKMLQCYVPPAPYTRDLLFRNMLAGKPSLVTGFPIPVRGPLRDVPPPQLGPAIAHWLSTQSERERYRIFTGRTRVLERLTLREIGLKWRQKRTLFGVTDLHIRKTVMEDIIDPDVLSGFNVLPRSTVSGRECEIFSFVISTRGQVTDSHSDDPDSSNYCFVGRKFWLAWDTYEGAARGMQDAERAPLAGKARFDMETWLSLRSACWCVVNAGETLLLPAHLTHKVITLESYIGVGGFFVALPNCLRLLAHWIVRGPLWSKRDASGERDDLLAQIAQTVRNTIIRLGSATEAEQTEWGYDHLEDSAKHFIKTCPSPVMRRLWSDPRFRSVADVIDAPWPASP